MVEARSGGSWTGSGCERGAPLFSASSMDTVSDALVGCSEHSGAEHSTGQPSTHAASIIVM
jgi:hypothetical protein